MDLAAYKDKLVYYAEAEEGKNQKTQKAFQILNF